MLDPLNSKELKRRTPVWAALSDLFLVTDVSLFDEQIIRALRKSRYAPHEAEAILREEVAPVFYMNLLSVSGDWSAWPPEHVCDQVLEHLERSDAERAMSVQASASVVERVIDEHWPRIYRAVWRSRPQMPQLALPHFTLPDLHLPRPQIKLTTWRLALWSPLLLLVLVLLLAGYELWAVDRARARTPQVLEEAWAQAGPSLLNQMSVSRIEALLRVEDPSFRTHRGVDFSTPGQGMTTITQGLVKRLYFEHFTPGFAKIEQSLIARFVLDSAITKNEQLELFLGLAYFGAVDGRDVIGFRDAAQTYFGKTVAELDHRQFLALVAMLVAPNDLRPGSPQNAERVARIERLLAHRCAATGLRDVWLEACAL